jgi:7,8-dihydropterin-6-yl-methyl-4-(beta-D-ribofuranosyl)aminobenzene 5'-phosphate synthase
MGSFYEGYGKRLFAKDLFGLWLIPLAVTLVTPQAFSVTAGARNPTLRITILFNNIPHQPGLTTGWGFSCLLEGLEKTILFDTGANGDVLLANMRRLDIEPKEIDLVFISHIHGDHTGGLASLLAQHPQVDVVVPEDFPASFTQMVTARGARVTRVKTAEKIIKRVQSTGQFSGGIVEQAMMVETNSGLVVITGCAHPGIARIAERATRLTGKKIHLLMGGFHLGGTRRSKVEAIISRLKMLAVEKVAPSHCTGESATMLFRQAWGENFLAGGLGAVIELPLR